MKARRAGGRRTGGVVWMIGVALLWVIGCAAAPREVPLCPPSAASAGIEAAMLDPELWLRVLAPGFDLRGDPTAPARACNGEVIAVNEPLGGAASDRAPPRRSPRRALDLADLVIVAPSPTELLVWLQIDHFDDGEALGPVALLSRTPGQVVVVALGSLRAPGRGSSLTVVRSGEARLLVVEGARCVAEPEGCAREAQIFAIEGTRLRALTLRLPSAGEATARIVMSRAESQPTRDGSLEGALDRHLVVSERGIEVRELEEVRACRRGAAGLCPVLMRRSGRCAIEVDEAGELRCVAISGE